MAVEPRPNDREIHAPQERENRETLDPNDTDRLREQIKGQTTEHANPPRFEDEGQSGG